MDAIASGSSSNFRQSYSRARSTPCGTVLSDQSDVHHGNRFNGAVSNTTSSVDMSPSKVENAVSDFDTALDLLENNTPEQRLDLHMPYSRYLELEECWSEIKSARYISEDQKYPSLAYNSVAEIVTVITVPRDLYEGGASDLVRIILDGAQKYLFSHGADVNLIQRIRDAGAPHRKAAAPMPGAKRTAEGGQTMITIEVGFTENYAFLCEDKNFWILGQHVDICILVCIEESPKFRNPRTPSETFADVDVEVATTMQNVAAELREAFIEVWRTNRRGPADTPPKSLGLRIRDLVQQNYLADARIPDGGIVFDGDEYLGSLIRYLMRETARERYVDFISP
ncbi:hypothetical protein V1525DRAFT_424270 [Lipomyces kononenkoae]|uniref:Uncharacterized protein n=1 Tax=Lipomyces kononenkoae TaxID=34357 RepID=A0ACC3T812_LIPKO